MSLEVALLCDFWRRGWWSFLFALAGMTALPILIYGALWNESGGQLPSAEINLALHVPFALMFGFVAMTAMFQAQGKVTRFFPRPISTARLVACQMSAGLLTVGIVYLVGTGILNLVAGVQWPLWGPALFFAAATACALGAIWWAEGSVVLQLAACVVVATPLSMWFVSRYGVITGGAREMWHVPTASEAAFLVAITASGFVWALWGVSRQRRGVRIDLDALLTAVAERLAAAWRGGEKFRSALAANAWFEWRQKHALIPVAIVAALVLLALGLRAAGFTTSRDMLEGGLLAAPVGALAMIVPLLFGFIIGNCGTSQRPLAMRPLLATRPVTSQALANSLLSTGALMFGAAGMVWGAGLCLGIGLCWRLDGASELAAILDSAPSEYWRLPLTILFALIAGWGLFGLVLATVASGQSKLIVGLAIGIWPPLVLFTLVAKMPAPEYRALFDEAGVGVAGLLAIGIFASVVAWTRRRRIVTERTTWLSVSSWLVLSGATVVFCLVLGLAAVGWLVLFAGLCALVVLPFVSVPLAVEWNRHG